MQVVPGRHCRLARRLGLLPPRVHAGFVLSSGCLPPLIGVGLELSLLRREVVGNELFLLIGRMGLSPFWALLGVPRVLPWWHRLGCRPRLASWWTGAPAPWSSIAPRRGLAAAYGLPFHGVLLRSAVRPLAAPPLYLWASCIKLLSSGLTVGAVGGCGLLFFPMWRNGASAVGG